MHHPSKQSVQQSSKVCARVCTIPVSSSRFALHQSQQCTIPVCTSPKYAVLHQSMQYCTIPAKYAVRSLHQSVLLLLSWAQSVSCGLTTSAAPSILLTADGKWGWWWIWWKYCRWLIVYISGFPVSCDHFVKMQLTSLLNLKSNQEEQQNWIQCRVDSAFKIQIEDSSYPQWFECTVMGQ